MMYTEVTWKTLLAFVSLWGLARLIGKKQISQLTLFDYITGITIGSVAGNVVTPGNPTGPLLLAMALWGSLSYGMHLLDLKDRKLARILDGRPTVLVQHGQVLEHNLAKAELNLMHLMSMLRAKGYFNVNEVEFAILETNGQLSVLPRSQFRGVQPRDLGLPTHYEGLSVPVMHEGRPLAEELQKMGLTQEWLLGELARRGIDPGDVFSAWLGTDGNLGIDTYKDQVH